MEFPVVMFARRPSVTQIARWSGSCSYAVKHRGGGITSRFCSCDRDLDPMTITGSAVALHCCKAHAKINRKMGNSTPCKIVTPKNFILKLCTRDYVGEVTRHANFRFNRYSGGFCPNRRNVTTLWLFLTVLSCPYLFFLDPTPRSNRWTDFHALWLKRRDSAQGWSFWGLDRWMIIFGGNMPPKLPKNGPE